MTSGRAGVVGWGANNNQQLGLNRPQHLLEPAVIGLQGPLAGKQVAQVVDGRQHALALTTDGQVYVWGSNLDGELGTGDRKPFNEPTLVPQAAFGGQTVVALTAGVGFSLALTQTGLIYGWGRSEYGQLGQVTESVLSPVLINGGALAGRVVKKVVAGYFHAVALTDDGVLIAWGSNYSGQLGNGNVLDTSGPVQISASPALSGAVITDIAVGGYHSLALAEDGRAFSWGLAWVLGRSGNNLVPGSVDMSGVLTGKKLRKITAGYAHTLALADDGKLYAWGTNSIDTYLGDPTFTGTSSSTPRAVRMHEIGDREIIQIVAGRNHSTVLTADGSLYSWGFNGGGQFGNGAKTSHQVPLEIVPRAARVGRTITALSSSVQGGGVHVITNDGAMLGWGWDHWGQVGNGSKVWRSEPADIMPNLELQTAFRVAAAADSSALVAAKEMPGSSNNLYRFGNFMSTGNGTYTTVSRPLGYYPATATPSLQIVAGHEHMLLLDGDGKLYGWGDNANGQVGSGSTNNLETSKVEVSRAGVLAGKSFSQIAAGADHSLVLTTDGGLYSWGANDQGQLGDGSLVNRNVPVAVDISGALAGKTPAFIAAGDRYSLVVTADGLVYGWGANERGQLGDGTTTQRSSPVLLDMGGALAGKLVTKVAAGSTHSLALTADGLLFGWGSNDHGQLGTGTASDRELTAVLVVMNGALTGKTVAKITCGMNFTLFLASDGSVCGMGDNSLGSLATGDRDDRTAPAAVIPASHMAGRVISDLSAARSGYSVLAVTRANGPEISINPHDFEVANDSLKTFVDGQPNLLFAPLSTGRSFYGQVNLLNNGQSALGSLSVTLLGPDAARFTVTSPPATLAPGAYRYLSISAYPPNATPIFATLRITSSDPAYPTMDVPLSAWRMSIPSVQPLPAKVSVSQGFPVEIPVTAAGTALAYEWRKNRNYDPDDAVISNRPALRFAATALSDAGYYLVLVNDPASSSWLQSSVLLEVIPTPLITSQPLSLTVAAGGQAIFTVAATSPTGSISYQWRKGGSPIPGATQATLTIDPVIPSSADSYDVLLTNSHGTIASRAATLQVTLAAPVIPITASTLAFAGEPGILRSNAYGQEPLQFQWFKKGKSIAGATAWSYTVTPKMSSSAMGEYSFTVKNALITDPLPSASAWLGMMTRAPASVSVVKGKPLTLTCTASSPAGTSLTYQWLFNGSEVNGLPFVFGGGTKTLQLNPASLSHAGTYTCRVTMTTPLGAVSLTHGDTQVVVVQTPVFVTESLTLPVVRVGQAVSHQITAQFIPTSYTATGLPSGIQLNRTTGQLTGRPKAAKIVNGQVVPYKVRFTLANAAGSVFADADWTIQPLPGLAVGVFRGLVARQSSLNGIAGLDVGLGGLFELTLASSGSFTGSLRLGTLSYPLRGSVQLASFAAPATTTQQIARKSPLTPLTVTLSINGTTGALDGTVSDGTHQAAVTAWRTTPTTLYKGTFNAALQSMAPPGSSFPEGHGIASINIAATGNVTWTGRLADGSTITAATGVGPQGHLPLHLPLYQNKGSLQGLALMSGISVIYVQGDLDWAKSASAGGTNYPTGFALHDLELSGERYQRPPTGQNLLDLATGDKVARITLAASSLTAPLQQAFTMSQQQTAMVPSNLLGLKLSLIPSTGWFTGTFTSIETPKRAGTIQGILLPGGGIGLGYFLQPVPATIDPAKPIRSGSVEIIRQ